MENINTDPLVEKYVQMSKMLGVIYFLIPTIIIYLYTFLALPFRTVYILRFVLSLAIGIPIAAFAHKYGILLWIIKYRSGNEKASVIDGMAIGSSVGFCMALIPPFLMLIKTNHIEEVKWVMISIWVGAYLFGGIFGGIVAALGIKRLA